jgi:hypothetical protein
MKSVIFIHTAVIGRYQERLLQYLHSIQSSNLYDSIEYIYICYNGTDSISLNLERFDTNNKIKTIKVSNNLEDFELPTQQYMYNFENAVTIDIQQCQSVSQKCNFYRIIRIFKIKFKILL